MHAGPGTCTRLPRKPNASLTAPPLTLRVQHHCLALRLSAADEDCPQAAGQGARAGQHATRACEIEAHYLLARACHIAGRPEGRHGDGKACRAGGRHDQRPAGRAGASVSVPGGHIPLSLPSLLLRLTPGVLRLSRKTAYDRRRKCAAVWRLTAEHAARLEWQGAEAVIAAGLRGRTTQTRGRCGGGGGGRTHLGAGSGASARHLRGAPVAPIAIRVQCAEPDAALGSVRGKTARIARRERRAPQPRRAGYDKRVTAILKRVGVAGEQRAAGERERWPRKRQQHQEGWQTHSGNRGECHEGRRTKRTAAGPGLAKGSAPASHTPPGGACTPHMQPGRQAAQPVATWASELQEGLQHGQAWGLPERAFVRGYPLRPVRRPNSGRGSNIQLVGSLRHSRLMQKWKWKRIKFSNTNRASLSQWAASAGGAPR